MCDSDSSSSDSGGSYDSGPSPSYDSSPSPSYEPSPSPSFAPSAPTVDYSPTPDPIPAPAPASAWSRPDPAPEPTPEPETTQEYPAPPGTYEEGATLQEQFLADLAAGVVEELLEFETFDEYFGRTGRAYRGRRSSGKGRKKAVSQASAAPETRASAPKSFSASEALTAHSRSTAPSYDPADDADAISGPSPTKMIVVAVGVAGGLGLIAYLL